MIKEITSHANPVVKRIKSLALKKYRDEEKLFVAEGLRHVREALDAGWELDSLVFTKQPAELADISAQQIQVTDDIMQKIASRENAQTVLGIFKQRWGKLADVTDGLWVALEQIRDPGNLGTIMRTADSVGAKGVILIDHTCDPYSSESIRASMGSFARMTIVKVAGDQFINHQFNCPIIGTHLKGAVDYRTVDYMHPIILMMGNEQAGLTDKMADACTQLVKIPMTGKADSLNLAIATGVMLYEIQRTRL